MDIEHKLNESVNEEILYISDKLQNIERILDKNVDTTIYKVNILLNTLDKLNPTRLLRSGYAHIMKDGQLINLLNVKVGDELNIRTNDMKLKASVTKKEKL